MTLSKDEYTRRKLEGLCVQCGDPIANNTPPKARCSICLQKNSAVRLARRQKKTASGTCTECTTKAVPGHAMCQECIDDRTLRSQEKYFAYKQAGTCRVCGKDSGGASRCAEHKQAFQDWRERRKNAGKDSNGD